MRAPAFMFYPRDWVVDTRHLTRDQRCRYHDALCESWIAESYGTATEDQWREWLGYTPEEWQNERQIFARLFKVSRDVWVQSRMKQEREAQKNRRERAQRGARRTNAARTTSLAQRAPKPDHPSATLAQVGRTHSERIAVAVAESQNLAPNPPTPGDSPAAVQPAAAAALALHARAHDPAATADHHPTVGAAAPPPEPAGLSHRELAEPDTPRARSVLDLTSRLADRMALDPDPDLVSARIAERDRQLDAARAAGLLTNGSRHD